MSQKLCPKCHTVKAAEEFGANKNRADGLQSYCKVCRQEYANSWYEKNKELQIKRANASRDKHLRKARTEIVKYLKEHPCIDCGNSDLEVLEFDHKDRKTKSDNIATMIRRGLLWDTILKEIQKCDVRCANCHRKKTRKQMNYWLIEDYI